MWLIEFIPNWVYHTLLSLSVLGILLANLSYNDRLRFYSILLLCFSLYMEGSIKNEETWQAKIAEERVKVALAEAKSSEVNTVVVTKVLTKVVKIKEDTNANKEYITQYVARDLDSNCRLTNAAVVLVNAASQEEVPRSTGGVIEGTSEVKASEFLSTVNENYGTYYQVVEQLKGWQEWYYKQKKIFEE
ncbi:hypothetical protein EB001_24465 [bacterium]|nr:hypothetical protein [bacterium]